MMVKKNLKLILIFILVCIFFNYYGLMVARYDGLLEFSIGEFFEVSITTDEHILKHGSFVSREGEEILFNKCDISRMITVATTTADGESSH